MLLEIAEIKVREGAEPAFEAAMNDGGLAALAACAGVVSVRFGRGVENPSRFTFNVVWTSMEAHAEARALESFARFRSAFGDLTVGGAMQHYRMGELIPGPEA